MSEAKTVTPDINDNELVGEEITTVRTEEAGVESATESFMRIKYMDDEVVLYKNVNYERESHGMEQREIWDSRINEGYYKFANEEEVDHVENVKENGRLEELKDIKGIGESSLEELRKKGYENLDDVLSASVSALTNVPKIGRKSVQRIDKEFDEFEASTRTTQISTTATQTKSEEENSEEDDSDDDGWSQLVESDDSDWSMTEL